MNILLTGANGQLGWELSRTLAPLGKLMSLTRQTLDLADPAAIVSTVRGAKPDLIVNAAAYTAVDRAQTNADAANAVNARAPEIFAQEARALNAALIHFSTDYVFDGAKAEPYVETDATAPSSVYGQSKLAGEQAIAASGVAHMILRTSWVYSARGSNFLLTILKLARSKPELRVVADQIGAPTWARTLAEATAQIIERGGVTNGDLLKTFAQRGGVYHVSAAGHTSWHGFAEAIVREAGLTTPVSAIATAEYPLPAPRPANSLLSNAKIAQNFGIKLPDWTDGLKHCMAELGKFSAQATTATAVPR
jgi:dTDP-4-dehydrorhamnose reductase